MAKKIIPGNTDGLFVGIDNLAEFQKAIKRLARDEVLVGVPEETTGREDAISQASGITNASLAYIHDNGAPEARIPQRPFMIPGMERSKQNVTELLGKMANYGLQQTPNVAKVDEGFNRIGLIVRDNMREVIAEGIAPALADMTLRARAAKGRKGAKLELERRAAGIPPGTDLATPLLDTGELNKSLNWVVRKRSDRSA